MGNSNQARQPLWLGFYARGFWRVLITLTVLDYGGINTLRWFTEPRGSFLHPEFVSFWLGDSPVGLPLLGACMSVMLRRFGGSDRFYVAPWFNAAVLAVGVLISVGMLYVSLQSGRFDSLYDLPPGEIYHAIIFSVMFYLIVAPLIAVVSVIRVDWVLLGALIGASCWVSGILIDVIRGKF